jgi:hypothetical protein
LIFCEVDLTIKKGDEDLLLTDENLLNLGFIEYKEMPSGEGVFVNREYPIKISYWRKMGDFHIENWFWFGKRADNIKELKKIFIKYIFEQPTSRKLMFENRIKKLMDEE